MIFAYCNIACVLHVYYTSVLDDSCTSTQAQGGDGTTDSLPTNELAAQVSGPLRSWDQMGRVGAEPQGGYGRSASASSTEKNG